VRVIVETHLSFESISRLRRGRQGPTRSASRWLSLVGIRPYRWCFVSFSDLSPCPTTGAAKRTPYPGIRLGHHSATGSRPPAVLSQIEAEALERLDGLSYPKTPRSFDSPESRLPGYSRGRNYRTGSKVSRSASISSIRVLQAFNKRRESGNHRNARFPGQGDNCQKMPR